MSLLFTQEETGIDITGLAEVLDYTYDVTALVPKTVLCRVAAGSDDNPIIGGGNYTLHVEINGARVSPDSEVTVAASVDRALLQSREIVLIPGDQIAVLLSGLAGDTAIDTVATLIDMTPLTRSEIFGGGAVAVDHNYGSTNRFTYRQASGAGIDNAQIQAFLQEDYDAGNRSSTFVRGTAHTNPDGRWAMPIMLDAGTYVLVFFKQGQYGPDIETLIVA